MIVLKRRCNGKPLHPLGPVLVDASADVEVDAGRVIPGVFYPGWLFFVFLHLE